LCQEPRDEGDHTWQTFHSSEGRFRVTLPGSPSIDMQTLITAKGFVDLHLVACDGARPPISYAVYHSDLKEMTTSGDEKLPDQRLHQAREVVSQLLGGRIVEERPILLEGHPGLELLIHTATEGAVAARLFCVGDRFFLVLAVGEEVNLFKPPVRSFLDSFGLLRD
jgi:hypothetical protein